jgi:2-polyprenyl-3-methyl-5-hydroxy-6-metoxy-1,4-benzoquinol methylase
MSECPLCDTLAPLFVVLSTKARYYLCPQCDLMHVGRESLPTIDQEIQRYQEHNNQEGDPAYLEFLNRVWHPVRERLKAGATGLDFGSGTVPVLTNQMRREGYQVTAYDSYFAPDAQALGRHYDFIVASEVAEHFHHPHREWDRLHALLYPGGWLGVQTAQLESWEGFKNWHYHRDNTHVVFYSSKTMQWIAKNWNFDRVPISRNVVLFQKKVN